MVFPPFSIIIYMKFLALRILSILSALYLCTATCFLFSIRCSFRCTRPLQFVSGSLFIYDSGLCFRWSVPPLPKFYDLSLHRLLPLYIKSFQNCLFYQVLSYPFILVLHFHLSIGPYPFFISFPVLTCQPIGPHLFRSILF